MAGQNDFDTKNYQEIKPASPWHFFIPETHHIFSDIWNGKN